MPPSSRYERPRLAGDGWSAIVTCEAVPYQLEGQLDSGEVLYWRSRHRGWQFGIAASLHRAVNVAMQTHGEMHCGEMGIRQVVATDGHPLGTEDADQVVPMINALVHVYRAGFQLLGEASDVRK